LQEDPTSTFQAHLIPRPSGKFADRSPVVLDYILQKGESPFDGGGHISNAFELDDGMGNTKLKYWDLLRS
jgi:hypothetical protein